MVEFSEPDGVDALPYNNDVIMNIGDINHRFIKNRLLTKNLYSSLSTTNERRCALI